MISKTIGLLTGHTQTANRIAQWKQEQYDEWERWVQRVPGSCPPPPLNSSWWDEAIREDEHCHTQHDSLHFTQCKCAYMDAYKQAESRRQAENRKPALAPPRPSVWSSNKKPGAGDLMG